MRYYHIYRVTSDQDVVLQGYYPGKTAAQVLEDYCEAHPNIRPFRKFLFVTASTIYREQW